MTEASRLVPDNRPIDPSPGPAAYKLSAPREQLKLLCWHLDRYDRLRASTANRAGVVLSAGALISAANAVILTRVLGTQATDVPVSALTFCITMTLINAALIVLTVMRAASVLVTAKDSRALFAKHDELPSSPLFNGTDTVGSIHSFAEFSSLVATQQDADAQKAAEVELWIGIQQHRRRYLHLRSAVRLLRYASVTLLIALVTVVAVELLYRMR